MGITPLGLQQAALFPPLHDVREGFNLTKAYWIEAEKSRRVIRDSDNSDRSSIPDHERSNCHSLIEGSQKQETEKSRLESPKFSQQLCEKAQ